MTSFSLTRLPSYIKLERAIDDDNSEDSTSTADSSESGVGGCGLKSRLKLMSGGSKKSMANASGFMKTKQKSAKNRQKSGKKALKGGFWGGGLSQKTFFN